MRNTNIPYSRCTIDHPNPIFHDKTIDIIRYHDDYNSDKLSRIVAAMNNQNVVNMNILCPWNCLCSCLNAGYISLDIMIQRMLPKIIIPLYSSKQKYKLVHWSCNQYYLAYNNYQMIMLNDEWPVQPSVALSNDGLQVMTCKYHNRDKDKLTLFAPQSPKKDIFNAEHSDQLAHCIQIS